MNFQKYPHDTQICKVKYESCKYPFLIFKSIPLIPRYSIQVRKLSVSIYNFQKYPHDT
jgi:hypothetical protein